MRVKFVLTMDDVVVNDQVVDQITARCQDRESGARNIDHIVNKTLLPLISTEILSQIGAENSFNQLQLSIDDQGEFNVELIA